MQITSGVPNFIIVGLADKTIAESKERVRAALSSIGLALPAKRIVVNLAPADLIKEGSHFDLASLGVSWHSFDHTPFVLVPAFVGKVYQIPC